MKSKNTDTAQPETAPSTDIPPQITALCTTPHLSEEQIKSAFITMLNNMIESSDEIAAFYDVYIAKLTDTAALEAQKAPLETKAVALTTQIHDWIRENASHAMAKEVYDVRYEELNGELTAIKDNLNRINDELLRLNAKHINALQVMNLVHCGSPVTQFDAGLFGALVDTVTVYNGKMVFRLKDGSERVVEN